QAAESFGAREVVKRLVGGDRWRYWWEWDSGKCRRWGGLWDGRKGGPLFVVAHCAMRVWITSFETIAFFFGAVFAVKACLAPIRAAVDGRVGGPVLGTECVVVAPPKHFIPCPPPN